MCFNMWETCERHHTREFPPIIPRAVLRPQSVAVRLKPRDKLSVHFQLLKLAPSGLNPPYFVLPTFLFVEFHFQRLRMHYRHQILMIAFMRVTCEEEPCERKIRARICLKDGV